MEIEIKSLKKLKNDIILSKAKEIDSLQGEGEQKGNNKIDGKEIFIFETEIAQLVNNKTVSEDVYKQIFGFDISNRGLQETYTTDGNKVNKQNVVVSDTPIQVNVSPKYKPDGSLENPKDQIEGSIIFNDKSGQEHTLSLVINPARLYDNKKSGIDAIVSDLQKAINKLPPSLKSAMINEINRIEIYGENTRVDADDGQGDRFISPKGKFDPSVSTISLYRCYDGNVSKDGINVETLSHELGHAMDEDHINYASSGEFKQAFDNLVSVLERTKNPDYLSGKNDLEHGYWLKNHKEAFAELSSYFAQIQSMKANGEIPNFKPHSKLYMLNKILNSDNPEVKSAVQELLSKYRDVVDYSNSRPSEDRKGNNSAESVRKRIEYVGFKFNKAQDPQAFKAFTEVLYSTDDSIYDVWGDKLGSEILFQYWQYKQKDSPDSDKQKQFDLLDPKAKQVFELLDKKTKEDPNYKAWGIMSGYMDSVLKNLFLS